jgi:hypothetical protein
MKIKTRAKALALALLVVATSGVVGGALFTRHTLASTGQHVTAHDTCQTEDSPCWRSPQGRHVDGQGGHYACTDSALPCYDEWVAG